MSQAQRTMQQMSCHVGRSAALRSRMNLPDDNAAIVNHIPSSMHTDVLSLLRRIKPDDDYVEVDNLTWCAAGLASLRSVIWDRVREATSSDVDMHTLEEMATDGILDSKIEMPETIRDYHKYRENTTSTDGVILCTRIGLSYRPHSTLRY